EARKQRYVEQSYANTYSHSTVADLDERNSEKTAKGEQQPSSVVSLPFKRPAFLEPVISNAGMELYEDLIFNTEDAPVTPSKPKPRVEIVERIDEFDGEFEVPASSDDLGIDDATAA